MVVFLMILIVLGLSYLVGSLPFGLVFVKIFSGKDVRSVESGRTGGTNAMRAAGTFAGILTALFDVTKGVASGWLVTWLAPDIHNPWVRIAAAAFAIIGHNYSIFLPERTPEGKVRLRGGAGGATTLGGAIALWPLSGAIIFPLALMVFLFIGYASVATMSIAFIAFLVFAIRAILGISPWAYAIYGIVALIIVAYALRPNIKRLIEGNERIVGLRARLHKATNRQTYSNEQIPVAERK